MEGIYKLWVKCIFQSSNKKSIIMQLIVNELRKIHSQRIKTFKGVIKIYFEFNNICLILI